MVGAQEAAATVVGRDEGCGGAGGWEGVNSEGGGRDGVGGGEGKGGGPGGAGDVDEAVAWGGAAAAARAAGSRGCLSGWRDTKGGGVKTNT